MYRSVLRSITLTARVLVAIDGPQIQTGALNQTTVCTGSSLSVPFSTTGTFNPGNVFRVELSAPGGSFAASTTIGSGATSPIAASLPVSVSAGSYRVRVVSSDPLAEGTPSVTTLTVSAQPSVTATNSSPAGQTAVGGALSLSVTVESTTGQNLTGATYRWTGPDNFSSTVANPTLPTTTTASNGTYAVTVTTPGGCTATAQTSVSLANATCTLTFDGPLSLSCVAPASGTATTRTGTMTVKLSNVPDGKTPVVSLYRQTTATASQPIFVLSGTATGTQVNFADLADGTYRVTAYVLDGTDTCRATLSGQTSLSLTVRCNSTSLNIRIKAVDATPTETDLLPRVGGGLGTLNLSVEELDGEDLTGYTHLWSEPTSTSATTSTATSTTLTARRIGEYKVTLTNASGDTLVAYTTLRAKPCRAVAHTYSCGTASAAPGVDINGTGLSSLAPGDTIRTGDFDVIVTEVQGGSNGTWTGIGYTEIPYLADQRIAVEFTGATINDCYEFTGKSGRIQSAYNPNYFAEQKTQPGSSGSDDPNRSLVKLQDLLQNFTATPEQKQEIDKLMASLNDQLVSDPTLTDDQRTESLNALTQAKAAWDTLKACSSAGGRLAAGARAAAGSCSKESVVQNLNQVHTSMISTLGSCYARPPTTTGVEGQTTFTIGTRTTGGPDGRLPESCTQNWYYFAGAANRPLLRQMTTPSITDWSAGWYSHKDYIDRVRRVIRAIVITTGDVRALSPGTDVAQEVALFDEFVNGSALSDQFLTSIAADYNGIRRGADFSITGAGTVEPVYIEFDLLTLGSIVELKSVVRAGVGLTKAALLGARNTYITARLATQLRLAKVGTSGTLQEIRWLEENIANASIINSIELKSVKFLDQFGSSQVGDLILIKLRNNTWKIFSGIRSGTTSILNDVIRLFDRTNSLNSVNINGKILPDVSYRIPGQSNRFSVKIFEGASDSEIRQLAEKLAGKPLIEVKVGEVWTETAVDGTKINLRNVSKSEPVTKAKWTIDVINPTKINPLKLGNTRGQIELKFK